MKKQLLRLSVFASFLFWQTSAQNDTLMFADFETDPASFIINSTPSQLTSDTSWYNYDADGIPDGSGASRPLEWFWYNGFATVDSSNGVLASSSWTNGSVPTQNWLITESVMISDTTADLYWKSAPYQTPRYLDGYIILASTASNDFTDFTDTLFNAAEYLSLNNGALPNSYASYSFSQGFVHGMDATYTEFDPASDSSRLIGVLRPQSVSLAQYAGQHVFIAFIHNCVDDNLLAVDDIMIKGTNSVGISESKAALNFNAYPNPVSDKLKIDITLVKSSDITINVFDISGRNVASELFSSRAAGKNNLNLDLSAMATGAYTLQIVTNEGISNSKLQVK